MLVPALHTVQVSPTQLEEMLQKISAVNVSCQGQGCNRSKLQPPHAARM